MSWGRLGGVLGRLGASWDVFGASLGRLGGILGDLGAILGDLGASRNRPEAKAQKRRKRLEGDARKFAEGPSEMHTFWSDGPNLDFWIRGPRGFTRPIGGDCIVHPPLVALSCYAMLRSPSLQSKDKDRMKTALPKGREQNPKKKKCFPR